jgi:intron-binding protein aquarius
MQSPVELEEELEAVRESVRGVCWRHKLQDVSLMSSSLLFGSVEKVDEFYRSLSSEIVSEIVSEVFLIDEREIDHQTVKQTLFQNRLLLHDLRGKKLALFPTEREDHHTAGIRLGLQYLCMSDLVERNRRLFRAEAAWLMKNSVEDAVARLKPRWSNKVLAYVFEGASRMGLEVKKVDFVEIEKSSIFSSGSNRVFAEISVNVASLAEPVLAEWDSLRVADCLLLASLSRACEVEKIRGSELVDISDGQGNSLSSAPFGSKPGDALVGTKRVFKLSLDPLQYDLDLLSHSIPEAHVVVRVKDSHFKNMLKALSEMNVAEWLRDTLAGYGDPLAVGPAQRLSELRILNLCGIFKNLDHFHSVYPEVDAVISPTNEWMSLASRDGEIIPVSASLAPLLVPTISFTAPQIKALVSASLPGLTLVRGGPGTGKTSVTVELIRTLYRNASGTTLLVAKSNESLNAILSLLEVPREYVLKPAGNSDDAFSRHSVTNHILQLRIDLLAQVKQLAVFMGFESEAEHFAYSCDTANQFFVNRVKVAIQRFENSTANSDDAAIKLLTDQIENDLLPAGWPDDGSPARERAASLLSLHSLKDILFPFRGFAADTDSVVRIFEKLNEVAPFEILRSLKDRSQYLLCNQARVVALTSAALCSQSELLKSKNFKVSTLIAESQMLEVETLLALSVGQKNLERFVIVGDELDLPPVVTNKQLSEENNFQQTLFERLVRLGAHTVTLDTQFRSPKAISHCWTWKYNIATPHESSNNKVNGVKYIAQFVDVPDFNGQGETQPMLHQFQNLGEAEFIVAFYMYLRLNGVDRKNVSILSSYNGQRLLIDDILKTRCGSNPLFGLPAVSTTIDQYQGQENKIVLVSLVRTESPGHNSDSRRLVCAFSRASQGLFVFGRRAILESANTDVKNMIHFLAVNGTKLALCVDNSETLVQNVDEMWDILRSVMQTQLASQ